MLAFLPVPVVLSCNRTPALPVECALTGLSSRRKPAARSAVFLSDIAVAQTVTPYIHQRGDSTHLQRLEEGSIARKTMGLSALRGSNVRDGPPDNVHSLSVMHPLVDPLLRLKSQIVTAIAKSSVRIEGHRTPVLETEKGRNPSDAWNCCPHGGPRLPRGNARWGGEWGRWAKSQKEMSRTGIEPVPRAWKARMITTSPTTLDDRQACIAYIRGAVVYIRKVH